MNSNARTVINSAISQGRFVLTESETKELCKSYGLPVIEGYIAANENDAVRIANRIGYPVALKIASPHILHKSDAGGVMLNLSQDSELKAAYRKIIENARQYKADANIQGVLVQKMAKSDGKEVIVGATANKQFGKAVMFGLGGIFVEALKDVVFRVAPVDKKTATDMIKEIRGYDILRGIRGAPPSDISELATIIEKVSHLVTEFPEIDQLDLNPIFVYGKGAIIVDARATLVGEKPAEQFRYSSEQIISQMTSVFRPKAVAIIGASPTPGKIGYSVTKNLLDGGYQGNIYPIHPEAHEVLGLKAYRTISEVPEQVDVGVVCIPAKFVPELIGELGKAKVAGAILIPSGFAEIGNHALQQQVVEAGRKHGVRLMGPNIYGYYYTPENLCATFCTPYTLKGKVALSSQSGGVGMSIIGFSRSKKMGVSAIVGLGNKCDIDEDDLIEFFGQDPNTQVIAQHVEDLKDGRAFMEAAKKVSKEKPIIVLKAGRTELGERAAASHTGALAGTDAIYDAAFKQCGVVRAKTLYELLDWSRALQMLPTPLGENVVIITGAGGSGVLLADACVDYGLKLMKIPPDLDKAFKEFIPPFGASGNPIDITGGEPPETYFNAIKLGLTDSRIHALILGYWHTIITPPMAFAEVVAKAVEEAKQEEGGVKPVVCSLVGDVEVEKACQYLEDRGILAYPYTIDAPVSALAAKYKWARYAGKIFK